MALSCMSRRQVRGKGKSSKFSQLVTFLFHPCTLMNGSGIPKHIWRREARMFSSLEISPESKELEDLKITRWENIWLSVRSFDEDC